MRPILAGVAGLVFLAAAVRADIDGPGVCGDPAILTWDELGSDLWDSFHWLGGPPAIPDAATDAVLAATNADTVTVNAAAAALSLTVDGGTVFVTTGGNLSVVEMTRLGAGGTLTVNGGTMTTTSFENTSGGKFNHANGTLTVHGGTYAPGTTHLWVDGNAPHLVLDGATPSGAFNSLLIGTGIRGALTIAGGTHVSCSNVYASLFPTTMGTVTVDGGGSTLTASNNLYLGGDLAGSGGTGTLAVTGGGHVSSAYGYVSTNATSTGAATVDGGGSTWTLTSNLYVGNYGGGTLEVTGGGHVASNLAYVGRYVGSTGEVSVDGGGSTWTTTSELHVGYQGAGTLTVTGGGQVLTGGEGYVATFSGSGAVTVDGGGSTWTVATYLYVGKERLGTMTVTGGGQVASQYGYVGWGGASTGHATVSGSGSAWTTSSLNVGLMGAGTLAVQDEGLVSVGGTLKTWAPGVVTLDGGTIATQTFDRTAGTFNWNAGTLRFTGNLLVDAGQPFGSSVTVGSGRNLEVADTLTVGSGGTVTLDGGAIATQTFNRTAGTFNWNAGTVRFTSSLLVDTGQSFGSSATVGSGRNLEVAGTLTIGAAGAVTLDGGTITTTAFGNTAGGTFNHYDGTFTVRGGTYAPGTANLTVNGNTPTALPHLVLDGATSGSFSNVRIGDDAHGALTVTGGSQLATGGGAYVGYGTGSTGEVTVDGSGSTWSTDQYLVVGNSGAGTLAVTGGGQVATGSWGYVGYHVGSTSQATVDGDGSTWTITGNLYLGGSESGAGGTGTLTVRNDGLVSVGGTLKLWPAGTLTADGGTVTAGGLAGPAGAVVHLRDPAAGTALTVGSDASDTFSGTIGDDTGPGSLTKVGSGTQTLGGASTYSGGTKVLEGTLLVSNTSGSGTGTGPVTVGAATLAGTGFINGPVILTGDSTLTSTGTLTIDNTLTIDGLANQIAAGTIWTTGDVTIDPGAVFIINGTLGGDLGSLVVRGTLMGKGTINKNCLIEAGGVLSPGSPSTIEGMAQILDAPSPRNLSFEIGAANPNYASPSNSLNDLIRLTDAAAPFADAAGGAPAAFTADTVIDVYFLWSDPTAGEYKAEFFAATDFTDAIADATCQYWRLDPHGSRFHNGNFFSPLDESLVDWSVVPETAAFADGIASGYITQFAVVPEPATLALLAAGTLLLLRRPRH